MKRKLFDKLYSEKDSKKISIIIGPRQVGKTTLLKQLKETLGGLYVDLDILENVERFSSYTNFMNSIKLEGYNGKDKFYLFLDEFQKYKDFSKILKNVYDNEDNIKIYATGSSSITIKKKIQESLAGRKFLHKLLPLDFEEFLIFKNEDLKKYKLLKKFKGTTPIVEYQALLEEFLIYGGYPEVVLSKNKEIILKSILDTFIKKDLVDYLNISEIIGVKKLIQVLSINNGQKINISDLCQVINLSREKIENYFEVLEEVFILKKVTPYYTNKQKEIVKSYKQYFIDPGVRNYFCNNFNPLSIRNDEGFLFETFILGEVLKNSEYEVKFWQNKQGLEVDFIIDKVFEQIALEVKYKTFLKNEDYKNFKYLENIQKKFVVNLKIQNEKHLLFTSIKEII